MWETAENENSFVKAQLAVGYFDDAWPPPPFNLLPAVCGPTVLRLLSPAALPGRLIKACALLLRIFKAAANASRDACSWLAWLAVLLGRICREMLRCTCAPPGSRYKTVDDAADGGPPDHDPYRDLNPSDVCYVDERGKRWSEHNTIRALQEKLKLQLRDDENIKNEALRERVLDLFALQERVVEELRQEIETLRERNAAAEERDLIASSSDDADAAPPAFELRLPKPEGRRMEAEAATPRGGSLPVKTDATEPRVGLW